jgi:hypothetical protein
MRNGKGHPAGFDHPQQLRRRSIMRSIAYRLLISCLVLLLAFSLLAVCPKHRAAALAPVQQAPVPAGLASWWPAEGNANNSQDGNSACSAPMVVLNPASQLATGGSLILFAFALGNPAPSVQWQVSTDGGVTFTNIPGATGTTLSLTPPASQTGGKYLAVFTNVCGTATTTAATLSVPDTCLTDFGQTSTLQWNSVTGQYKFTLCSSGFMLPGTGTAALVNGIRTLRDFKTGVRISAAFNTGQMTGRATLYLMQAQGVWQSFSINASNPNAACSCFN